MEKLDTLHPPTLPPHNEHPPSFNGSINHSHSHPQSPSAAHYNVSSQSTTSLYSVSQPHYPFGQHQHNGNDLPPPSSPAASRRSSFDTRLNSLHLNSPLNGTPAASQVSLANTLHRERSLHNRSPGRESLASSIAGSTNSTFNKMSGPPMANPIPGRVAPPIIGSSRYNYPHPNAPSPTKGFPYAFPDPDIVGPPPGSREKETSQDMRRTSTGSVSSAGNSIYSHNSTLSHPHTLPTPQLTVDHASTPHGGYSPFQNPTDSNYLHHHHYLDRRSKHGLSAESPTNSSTPYSRTPELRVSHKLAERKRRKEMKDLFDELRDALPAERGGKSSKWEVLTKGMY